MSMSTPSLIPTKKLYLIRHGQATHNVSNDWSHPDPLLTGLGRTQASNLLPHLPFLSSLPREPGRTLIVTSPLRRTLQTTLIGLGPLLRPASTSSSSEQRSPAIPVILLPSLQEWPSHPCDTGSPPSALRSDTALRSDECPDFKFDYDQLHEDWYKKEGQFASDDATVVERARGLRRWLREREEEHIVVVTHKGFLRYLTGNNRWHRLMPQIWGNCECRIYEFTPASSTSSTSNSTSILPTLPAIPPPPGSALSTLPLPSPPLPSPRTQDDEARIRPLPLPPSLSSSSSSSTVQTLASTAYSGLQAGARIVGVGKSMAPGGRAAGAGTGGEAGQGEVGAKERRRSFGERLFSSATSAVGSLTMSASSSSSVGGAKGKDGGKGAVGVGERAPLGSAINAMVGTSETEGGAAQIEGKKEGNGDSTRLDEAEKEVESDQPTTMGTTKEGRTSSAVQQASAQQPSESEAEEVRTRSRETEDGA